MEELSFYEIFAKNLNLFCSHDISKKEFYDIITEKLQKMDLDEKESRTKWYQVLRDYEDAIHGSDVVKQIEMTNIFTDEMNKNTYFKGKIIIGILD